MRIYVLRHCESASMSWRMSNPETEVPPPELLPDSAVALSPLGEEQGEALALFFAALPESERPTHGFSSPLGRTTQTGGCALSKLPVKIELLLDDRLREIDFGIFADLTKKGRAAKFPTQWQERRTAGKVHYRPEGGENWHDVAGRFLEFQKERINVLPPSAVVLISTHETVVSVSQWQWAGEDLEQLGKEGVPSASINTFDFDGTTFTLVSRQKLPPSPSGKDLLSMESKAKDI